MNPIVKRGRIGIITGAGPEAGIDLWQKILKHNKALHDNNFAGDLSAPEVIVHSIPKLGLAMDIAQYETELWQELKKALLHLDSDVDFVCIACNVLHFFSEKIKALTLSYEFISIVEVAEQTIEQYGNAALLSISKVIEFGHYSPYRRSAENYPLETPDPAAMDELVHHIKVHGGEHPDTVSKFTAIVNNLKANTLILACTDLPLLPLDKYNKTFIDASDMLAKTIAQKAFDYVPANAT
ncbi:aspartate/glutamate racemase family protein [Aliikangiella maris]|uniref:Aspartate/glutamate racemase family protein n=2 Tax=Aliikangiella maris TaxID=3162458 RepID=A0ABV3MS31_9GAMM